MFISDKIIERKKKYISHKYMSRVFMHNIYIYITFYNYQQKIFAYFLYINLKYLSFVFFFRFTNDDFFMY